MLVTAKMFIQHIIHVLTHWIHVDITPFFYNSIQLEELFKRQVVSIVSLLM